MTEKEAKFRQRYVFGCSKSGEIVWQSNQESGQCEKKYPWDFSENRSSQNELRGAWMVASVGDPQTATVDADIEGSGQPAVSEIRFEKVPEAVQTFVSVSQKVGFVKGSIRLSRTEMLVLTMVAAGMSNKTVAEELGVCSNTIRHHLCQCRKKLDAENLVQLGMRARDYGLVD